MTDETIVAVYDSAEDADAALRELRSAGVAESSITQHAGTQQTGGSTISAPPRHEGFWASLFGGTSDDDTVYDRSLESGSVVVSIRASGNQVDRITEILERHNPIDIDERASSYGTIGSGASGVGSPDAGSSSYGAVGAGAMGTGAGGMAAAGVGDVGNTETQTTTRRPLGTYEGRAEGTQAATGEGTMQLSEERLSVGKRLVNRGGTRIRRFVVETPVEEQVTLHDEKVTLERRPVTEGRPVTNADFTDKTIEMTESSEEAVVAKNAYVKEEIALRKDATERVETVRDTVRREDVEIEQIPAETTTSSSTRSTTTSPTSTPGATPIPKV